MSSDKYLVTGHRGFIGSHLYARLKEEGKDVIGIDLKEGEDLVFIGDYLQIPDVDYIFHLAAIPGVRESWDDFSSYSKNNIEATQRLLKGRKIKKFIYASSSSVYGNISVPMKEDSLCHPCSPYGVTKLAGENLCMAYWENFGIPVVSLRFFTVYGPGQRDGLAFNKFFKCIIKGEPITVYGDGMQARDFTYIDDIVEACILALGWKSGETYNISGGNTVKLIEAIKLIEKVSGKKVDVDWGKKQSGDAKDTWADISKAKRMGYCPKVGLEEGLKKQWEWQKTTKNVIQSIQHFPDLSEEE